MLDPGHTPSQPATTSEHEDGIRRESYVEEETETDGSVAHWANTGWWPNNSASMSQDRSESPKKRSRSSSYAQSFKDGEVPRAHSQAYEAVLAENGVYIEELRGRSRVRAESKLLCDQLLQSTFPDPEHSAHIRCLSSWKFGSERKIGTKQELSATSHNFLWSLPSCFRSVGVEEVISLRV